MTERYFILTDRLTGDRQQIAVADGLTPADAGYSAETHDWTAVARPLGECDRIEGDELVDCPVLTAQAAREAMLNAMTRSQLVDYILSEIRNGV